MHTQLASAPTLPAIVGDLRAALIPEGANKDARHRLGRFADWMHTTGRTWQDPDLSAYRDALAGAGYKPASVRAHLATVRARYQAFLSDNALRAALYQATRQHAAGAANRKALVDETLQRIENAIDPKRSEVKGEVFSQDRPDGAFVRLTVQEASGLLAAPGLSGLLGLRDTAIIALMLCTGIRERELCGLQVRDLRQRLGGALALHVREGKGAKERLIPYGALSWVLAIVDAWLQAARIEQGPVFRGFYKGNRRLRPGALSVRQVGYILARYPVMVDGEKRTVKPHDLRRSYARLLYLAGVKLVGVQQNLGHADVKTTLGYIGELDAQTREPPGILSFDLGALERLELQAEIV